MITTVYFVRHARSDHRVKDDVIRPLTASGLEDTKKVTAALKNMNISMIYSSPYQRTMDTVKDLSDHLGIETISIYDFRERKVGEWVEDFKIFVKKQWDDFDYKRSDGESLREVQKRNVHALLNIVYENEGKNIVIGTHGTALSTILNYFDSQFGFDGFWGIVDKMPYIMCMQFSELEVIKMEELELVM